MNENKSPTVPEALKALFTLGLIFSSHVSFQAGTHLAVALPVHFISEFSIKVVQLVHSSSVISKPLKPQHLKVLSQSFFALVSATFQA